MFYIDIYNVCMCPWLLYLLFFFVYRCVNALCVLVIDISIFFFTGLWRSIRLPTKCLDKLLQELPPVLSCVCFLRSLCMKHVFRVHAFRCISGGKHVSVKSYCWLKLSMLRWWPSNLLSRESFEGTSGSYSGLHEGCNQKCIVQKFNK